MFSITLLCMGKLKEKFYTAAAEEYSKRLRAFDDFRIVELPEYRLPDDPNETQIAQGLAREAEAIRKANEDAKKHLVNVPLNGTTIPHDITGYYSTAKVVLLPAPEGTGVIAGGAARAVLELAGVRDIRTKSFGTNNPINMVKATLEALKLLRSAEEVAKMRGKTVEELLG